MRRSRWSFWAGWIGVALVGAWALNLIWWGLLSPAAQEPTSREIVIPDGTAEAVAKGYAFPFAANQLSVAPGGTLRVWNQDSVAHKIGPFEIPAGSKAEFVAPQDSSQLVCTIHPSGYLGVDVLRRPPLYETFLPAILIGLPIGLLIATAVKLTERLGSDSGPQPASV